MINPGSQPVDGAREELAAANLAPFVAAIVEHGGTVTREPTRAAGLDADGRYGWRFEIDGMPVELLIPGVQLERVRDDLSATAPCLNVNSSWNRWQGAVYVCVPILR